MRRSELVSSQTVIMVSGDKRCYVWFREGSPYNLLEMMAAWKITQQQDQELTGKSVMFLLDNVSVISYIRMKKDQPHGAHVSDLALVHQMHKWSCRLTWHIVPRDSICFDRLLVKEQTDYTHRILSTSGCVQNTGTWTLVDPVCLKCLLHPFSFLGVSASFGDKCSSTME